MKGARADGDAGEGQREGGQDANHERARAEVAAPSPAVGADSVDSIRWVALLPASFGPRIPPISPAASGKSTPATASTGPPRVWKVSGSPRASTIVWFASPAI